MILFLLNQRLDVLLYKPRHKQTKPWLRNQLLGIIMTERKYKIQIVGRGEDMIYSDSDLELSLERTFCDGHRLFCDNTAGGHGGPTLPFAKRQEIIENLCEYFGTKKEPSIFVLDEADKDRKELEHLFSDLVLKGHKIEVEYDSAKKREQSQDKMYISILEAGKKLTINDVDIESVEDYWRWKRGA